MPAPITITTTLIPLIAVNLSRPQQKAQTVTPSNANAVFVTLLQTANPLITVPKMHNMVMHLGWQIQHTIISVAVHHLLLLQPVIIIVYRVLIVIIPLHDGRLGLHS